MGAKPDCDDGWIKLAHELDCALAMADFSKGARIVLHVVFAQVFGLAKRTSAVLSPTKIAADTGQNQPHISRAIRELTDSGVLHKKADGSYKFIKDYESWTVASGRGGASKTARLTPAERVSCANAPARAMAAKAYAQPGIASESAHAQPGIASESAHAQPGIEIIPNGVLNYTQRGIAEFSPPTPPLVNARAEFKKGEVKETSSSTTPAPAPAPVDEPIDPDTPRNLPELIARVRRDLGHEWAAVVEGNRGDIAVSLPGRFDCYLAALRYMAGSGKTIERPHSYAMTIARKFMATGIPAPSVAIEPAAAPARETSAERKRREFQEGIERMKERDRVANEREALDGDG